MNRASLSNLILLCFAVILGMSAPVLLRGAIYLSQHESDALHLIQGVLLMAQGALPHGDFQTPLGVLAFSPIAGLVRAGQSFGMAFILAQLAAALVVWPALIWLSASRLRFWPAVLLCCGVLVLMLSMVYGGTGSYVSISMHYNRWSWALAAIAILVAVLRPVYRRSQLLDGLVVGLALSGLGLLKVTYLIAFLPAIVLAMSLRGQVLAIALALIVGTLVILSVNLAYGAEFLWAYVGDLIAVAQSPIRPYPGHDLSAVMLSPEYLTGTVLLFFCIVILRQGARRIEGLALLLLTPGFIYVSYQNFGNDQIWLLILGVMIFALTPQRLLRNAWEWDLRWAYTAAGVAVLALLSPIMANMAFSPLRMALEDADNYRLMLPDTPHAPDVLALAQRMDDLVMITRLSLDQEQDPLAGGEEVCDLSRGVVPMYRRMAADVATEAGPEARIFVADLFPMFWLMGAGRPVPGAAIWNYGQIDGLRRADYLAVPRCPSRLDVRDMLLGEVETIFGTDLEQVVKTDLVTLYRLPDQKAPETSASDR